jgi:two-component system phosphate regulon response regulator PhoB
MLCRRNVKSKVLVVDDDLKTVALLEFNLRQAGFEVLTANNGWEALKKAQAAMPSLVLLDLMLPKMEGLEICKRLRQSPATSKIPIIILTAKASEIDRILGLEVGADDYVCKPFSPRELILRAKKLLEPKKTVVKAPTTLCFDDLVIDGPRHTVSLGKKFVELTATEFKLLTILAQRSGCVQTREKLLHDVWGYNTMVDTRTVDTHMRRLRQKLGPAAKYLDTIRGVGYRFLEAADSLQGTGEP